MLTALGYSVTSKTSSIEALKLFRSQPDDFDLVITDMTMPQLTGDQLAVELMRIRPDIPVIVCTGYSNKLSDETARRLGIKPWPINPSPCPSYPNSSERFWTEPTPDLPSTDEPVTRFPRRPVCPIRGHRRTASPELQTVTQKQPISPKVTRVTGEFSHQAVLRKTIRVFRRSHRPVHHHNPTGHASQRDAGS